MVDVVIESRLGDKIARMVADMLPATHYAVVMDANTAQALGDKVIASLGDSATAIVLDGTPKASMHVVEHIRTLSKHADALIAVGSGTINDLCKYASFLDGKPYGIFPTAPSMNGYNSANASISVDGHKTTLPAHAPTSIWCDVNVLSRAPLRLIQSGLGDSLCRPTAQFDWLLSHLLLDTPYSTEPFEMLAPYETQLFSNTNKLTARDPATIELLIRTLLASGDGMRMSGGSHPASQAEHMIAHTIEMMSKAPSPHYHGEEIAVTTLTTARLQHDWIAQEDPPIYTPKPYPHDMMSQHFSEQQCRAFETEYQAKRHAIEISNIQQRLNDNWDSIRTQLQAVILPLASLENTLAYAEMHRTSEALGWGDVYSTALTSAPFTRNRFTILDMV